MLNTENAVAAELDSSLSLYQLLDPDVLANPYALYDRIRSHEPVHWDIFLHAWVVTRYEDVRDVLRFCSADRTPTPAQLHEMGLSQMEGVGALMVKQMLFLDAPSHTRIRSLASAAFMPARIVKLRSQIEAIADQLLGKVLYRGSMDVLEDFASPLPAIVTAVMLGVPAADHERLKGWSADFAEILGNFQHNPDRTDRVVRAVENMTAYFQERIQEQRETPREGLIHSLLTAEIDGDRLSEEEVVANCIITMIGGQETTTNLIASGLLTLLKNPGELERLGNDPALLPSAVEELLRYESPSQHTARIAPTDFELCGKQISKGQAIIAVMAAGNRDPERFQDPNRLDLARKDNRHLAFGWAAHFCFGAPLARLEAQIALQRLIKLPELQLASDSHTWRTNSGLRGLTELPVTFHVPDE